MNCIIQDCVNEGYITAKKDGAGGIVGYMAHGIVADTESYGSVESKEGKNVGGIAGYANTLKDCYAMVNVEAAVGRKGAIAGQIAEQSNSEEDEEANVCRNYYVDDALNGIDDISYVGIAEPVSYHELLMVPGLPGAFRRLKVIYRVEDMYLGTEEVAFGESLAGLHYPEIPAKEGCYGVWPDNSDAVMSGNLVIRGEYHDDVRVVVSGEKDVENTEGEYQKPYALVEQTFAEDTSLKVSQVSLAPPDQAAEREYVMYEVSLENSGALDDDIFALRLLNPYEDARVWGLSDGVWTQLESKDRGQYLQVDMTGVQGIFCIVKTEFNTILIPAAVIGAAVLLFTIVLARIFKNNKTHKNPSFLE